MWNDQDKNIEVTKNCDLTKVARWRDFNDPVLNNLITTALKDNNKLQVSIGNILQANAEINKANYGWLPTAKVDGVFVAQAFDVNSSSNITSLIILELKLPQDLWLVLYLAIQSTLLGSLN